MLAYRMVGPGEARLVHTPEPRPAAGEVLLAVSAVGVCHSDVNIRSGRYGTGWSTPYTLGHEICAEVVEFGTGVSGLRVGQQVLVYGPMGCGRCRRCALGEENLCAGPRHAFGVGLGADGGMAPLLVTHAHRLVPADGLHPANAAALTDAALTSLHAVSMCRELEREGATAVVVGVGGLGHLAVQLLRVLTRATVVAVDVRPTALDLAARHGAHHLLTADADVAHAVRELTSGTGADAVLDFVVTPGQVDQSTRMLAPGGDLVLVGAGGGVVEARKPGSLPLGTRISLPTWGTRDELTRLVDLARTGKINTQTTSYPLAEAPQVLDELEAGRISGRAVILPADHVPLV